MTEKEKEVLLYLIDKYVENELGRLRNTTANKLR